MKIKIFLSHSKKSSGEIKEHQASVKTNSKFPKNELKVAWNTLSCEYENVATFIF